MKDNQFEHLNHDEQNEKFAHDDSASKTAMKKFRIEMYFTGGPGISEQTITRNVLAEGLEEAIATLEDEFGIIDDYKVYQTGNSKSHTL